MPRMLVLTQHKTVGTQVIAHQRCDDRARTHRCKANGDHATAHSLSGQRDLYSLGVKLKPYSNDEALAAVSNKSFACTMCGKCCTMAADAEVWLSDAEVSPLAQHLGVLPATFLQLYCQPYHSIPGWHLLLSKQQRQQQQQQKPHSAAAGGALGQPAAAVCVFLDESTNGCVVYPVRPVQCSTYPWWPEIMSDSHWRLEKEYMCEGFDHPSAEPLDRWYAAQQLQKSTQHTMALEAAKPVGWDAQQELYDGGSSNSSSVGGL